MQHPEAQGGNAMEPTVGELLRLAEVEKTIDKANPTDLRKVAKLMAKQLLVAYPAAIRMLMRDAMEPSPVLVISGSEEKLRELGIEFES